MAVYVVSWKMDTKDSNNHQYNRSNCFEVKATNKEEAIETYFQMVEKENKNCSVDRARGIVMKRSPYESWKIVQYEFSADEKQS